MSIFMQHGIPAIKWHRCAHQSKAIWAPANNIQSYLDTSEHSKNAAFLEYL